MKMKSLTFEITTMNNYKIYISSDYIHSDLFPFRLKLDKIYEKGIEYLKANRVESHRGIFC